MKAQFAVIATLIAASASGVFAESYPDTARVVSSTAIVQRVNVPRQECWTETQQVQTQSSNGNGIAGSIIGGVAGGLLGHQVGGGRGNTAATVAGAIGGAMLGDKVATSGQQGEVQQQDVRKCRNVEQWQDQVTGYQVTYEYKGHTFVTQLPQQPGDKLPVSVNVVPR
ncbi:glycine zipper 2TM domain-containing protein [Silvimonas sp. JCM 19000]